MNATTNMTMNIDDYIEAAREDVDETELAAARQRLLDTLPARRPARQGRGWLRMAGATVGVAAVAMMIAIAPTLLPQRYGGGIAQAQQWFERYTTLHMVVTTWQGDAQLTRMQVWTDDKGTTRVEVPPITHIVDPKNDVMHTLLPGNQVMTSTIGLGRDVDPVANEIGWLQELRDFQGQAEVLDERRSIDGIDAMGWRLSLPSGDFDLWVDPADNRPLLMENELPGGLLMLSSFIFDAPLPEGVFEPGSPSLIPLP